MNFHIPKTDWNYISSLTEHWLFKDGGWKRPNFSQGTWSKFISIYFLDAGQCCEQRPSDCLNTWWFSEGPTLNFGISPFRSIQFRSLAIYPTFSLVFGLFFSMRIKMRIREKISYKTAKQPKILNGRTFFSNDFFLPFLTDLGIWQQIPCMLFHLNQPLKTYVVVLSHCTSFTFAKIKAITRKLCFSHVSIEFAISAISKIDKRWRHSLRWHFFLYKPNSIQQNTCKMFVFAITNDTIQFTNWILILLEVCKIKLQFVFFLIDGIWGWILTKYYQPFFSLHKYVWYYSWLSWW